MLDKLRGRHADWRKAGFYSDAEGLAGGVLLPNPLNEEEQALHIAQFAREVGGKRAAMVERGIITGRTVGDMADTTDKVHSGVGWGLEGVHAARKQLQNQDRKRLPAQRR